MKMNDKEVLKRAIEIAVENGSKTAGQYADRINSDKKYDWVADTVVRMCCTTHDFAKAFWGSNEVEVYGGQLWDYDNNRTMTEPAWQHYLKQMILFEKPIMYLRKFVEHEEVSN